jgi:anthranilate synthase/aminodeoxychorismate synthase-like glutamine amidotransferase
LNILFFDNYDSFTFNLVHYLKDLGLHVRIIPQSDSMVSGGLFYEIDAVLIGPGPKNPKESGNLMMFLESCKDLRIPVLGVCLGHQALGELLGLSLRQANVPVHGKSSLLTHTGTDIFEGIPSPMAVGRYHSLIVEDVSGNADVEVLMEDEIGQIMAFKACTLPFWGIQFHPESVLTPWGKDVLRNWIKAVQNYKAINL